MLAEHEEPDESWALRICGGAASGTRVRTGTWAGNWVGEFGIVSGGSDYNRAMNKTQRRKKFIAEHPEHPTAREAREGNGRWRYLLSEESRWRRRRTATKDAR